MQEWWRGVVICQICSRSFQDSNGDGIGDLPGIRQRLGPVAALGTFPDRRGRRGGDHG